MFQMYPYKFNMKYCTHAIKEVYLIQRLHLKIVTFKSLMMTSSNGKNFRVTGHLYGEFNGNRWIPAQRSVTRSFDVFFDLHLNKRLSKHSWGWWFEMPSRPLSRYSNVLAFSKRSNGLASPKWLPRSLIPITSCLQFFNDNLTIKRCVI